MPDEILRTFIAIELEEPLRIAIARVQGKFKRQAPPGRRRWEWFSDLRYGCVRIPYPLADPTLEMGALYLRANFLRSQPWIFQAMLSGEAKEFASIPFNLKSHWRSDVLSTVRIF